MEVELGPASGPEGGAVDSEKQRIVNRETDPLGLNNCIISSAICINLAGAVFSAQQCSTPLQSAQ
jgi:16S rRNA U1498 N3-methylase RsmE